MASLHFEGETHAEIVAKVRRWLESVDQPTAEQLNERPVAKTVESAKDFFLNGLDSVDAATGGVVKKVEEAGRAALSEMSEQVAKQILRNLTR